MILLNTYPKLKPECTTLPCGERTLDSFSGTDWFFGRAYWCLLVRSDYSVIDFFLFYIIFILFSPSLSFPLKILFSHYFGFDFVKICLHLFSFLIIYVHKHFILSNVCNSVFFYIFFCLWFHPFLFCCIGLRLLFPLSACIAYECCFSKHSLVSLCFPTVRAYIGIF